MVKKEKMRLKDKVVWFIIIGVAVVYLMFCMTLIGSAMVDVPLNQETGDDICRQLTGNSTAVASVEANMYDGKLICTVPSYDSTQNIIVRSNKE